MKETGVDWNRIEGWPETAQRDCRRIRGQGASRADPVEGNAVSAIIREERIGGQRLILGDCLDVMKELGRFDAVVTDPPYGIARSGQAETHTKNIKHKRKHHTEKGWDEARPSKAFFDKVLSISDYQIIWGGNYFADFLPASMRWLYWDKGQDGLSMSDGELAWTSQQNALRAFRLNRSALARDGAVHPTQKPIALMEWCLGFLPDSKTILDPFMGSGTTLVACQRMGRSGTGIELDPEYFETACRRVDEAARQPDMFVQVSERTEVKQEELF